MQTFQKTFAAMSLIAFIGLVGCGKTEPAKTPADTKTKTEGQAEPDKTTPEQTLPEKTTPTPMEDPMTVDPITPTENGADAASGSTEKDGGLDVPNE